MAGLARLGIGRILLGCAANDCLLARTITSRTTRAGEDRPTKKAPYPYQEKRYTQFHALFDKTTSRFDENTKVIVVEGPVAAGKTKLAKQLSTELDMFYFPEANLDMIYINHCGYDLRKLDEQLPESCRSFDVMDFLRNPQHRLTARFQIDQYMVKLSQYIDALAHLFSTGQGVILDRCVYSDFVFAEAMYRHGYISKGAYKKYYEFRDHTIWELVRPHLVIYLDVPVPKVLDNIQKRAVSYEKDSAVLNPEYLQTMEKYYKQSYLKDISNHSELLVYDWSDEGDVEIVVEDIERIDFDKYDEQDSQMKDWLLGAQEDYALLRHKYSDKKHRIMGLCNVACYEVPELIVDGLDVKEYLEIVQQAPGEEYEIGYNKTLGDDGLLFKMKTPHRETLPLRERRKTL